jgi:hypothetical protein
VGPDSLGGLSLKCLGLSTVLSCVAFGMIVSTVSNAFMLFCSVWHAEKL